MALLIFSVFDRKYPFGENLVEELKETWQLVLAEIEYVD